MRVCVMDTWRPSLHKLELTQSVRFLQVLPPVAHKQLLVAS